MASEVEYKDLIGKKFKYGGRGPDYYDCYGLVREMYQRRGIWVPDYRSPSEAPEIIAMMIEKRQFWEKVEKGPYRVAMFRLYKNWHVGFTLPHNKFIHTWDRSGGVTVEKFNDWERRVIGFYDYRD